MRIVSGRHRGRRLIGPEGSEIRPTADRVRESLFNIIEHGGFGEDGTSVLHDAVVLDAFCGTGALGFEALSRGAAAATMLDSSQRALDCVRETARTLGETASVSLLLRDATRPGPAPRAHALAFLDPPYGEGLAGPALAALRDRGWLAAGAIVAVETGAKEALELPDGFRLLDERRYGAARITLLTRHGD